MYRKPCLEGLESRHLLAVDLLDGLRPSRPNSTELDYFLPKSDQSILAATSAGTWEIHADGTADRLHEQSVGHFRLSDEVYLSPDGIFDLSDGSYIPFPQRAVRRDGAPYFYRHPSKTVAFFLGQNPESRILEVWKTDGTIEGTTVMLSLTEDVNPLLPSNRFIPNEATENGLLYQLADQIWVLDFESRTSMRLYEGVGRYVGRIHEKFGFRMQRDDATELTFLGLEGQLPFSAPIDGDFYSYPYVIGDHVAYRFQGALHVTDGSPEFTGAADELLGIPADVLPRYVKFMNGSLFYFQIRKGQIPSYLAKVNPQSENEIVAELRDAYPRSMRVFGQHLSIVLGSAAQWVSDGTSEGTRLVLLRGPSAPLGDSMVFLSPHTEPYGRELGMRDLVTGQQFIIQDTSPNRHTLDITPTVLGVTNRDVAFFQHGQLLHSPVWFSYGFGLPRPLTELVPELWVEPKLPDGSVNPLFSSGTPFVHGEHYFFLAYTPERGEQWWVTDGTADATFPLGHRSKQMHLVGQVGKDWLFHDVDTWGRRTEPLLRTHRDRAPTEYFSANVTPQEWARGILSIRREDEHTPVLSRLKSFSLEAPVIVENRVYAVKRLEGRWWIWSSDGESTSEVEIPVSPNIAFRRVGSDLAIQDNLIYRIESQELVTITETEMPGRIEQHFYLADDRIIVAACSYYGGFLTRVSQFDTRGDRLATTVIPGCYKVRTHTPGNGVLVRSLTAANGDVLVADSGRTITFENEVDGFTLLGSGDRMVFRIDRGEYMITDGTVLGTQPIQHRSLFVGDQAIYYGGPSGLFRDDLRVLADVNGDDKLDTQDVDAFFAAVRNGESRPELNFTGLPSLEERDVSIFFERFLRTKRQDLDLDGGVAFSDFLQLSRNYGLQGAWSDGDIDGSGTIDFADFLELSAAWDPLARISHKRSAASP